MEKGIPWTISLLSSSGYTPKKRKNISFMDFRQKIGEAILQIDPACFRILAYERDDFPFVPGASVDENCRAALQGADIVLLFINERYGSLVPGEHISYTHSEYREAVKQQLTMIKCIDSTVYSIFKKHETDQVAFVSEMTAHVRRKYAMKDRQACAEDAACLYDFLREACNEKYNELMLQFDVDKADTFCVELTEKLKGLGKYIAALLSNRQYISSPGQDMAGIILGQNADAINRSYIPHTFTISSGIDDTTSLTDVIFSAARVGTPVLIHGAPGIGKSKALLEMFKKCYESENVVLSDRIPIFISMAGRGKHWRFSMASYIQELLGEENKVPYPYQETGAPYLFFVDALDEAIVGGTPEEYAALINSFPPSAGLVVTMRSNIINDVAAKIGRMRKRYPITVKLNGWGRHELETYLGSFVGRYITEEQKREVLAILNKQIQMDTSKIRRHTPLLVILALSIVCNDSVLSDRAIDPDALNLGIIYRRVVDKIIEREMDKRGRMPGEESPHTPRIYREIYMHASWYLSLQKESVVTYDTMCREICRHVLHASGERELAFVNDALSAFFINRTIDSLQPRHQQFVEYFIAERFIDILTREDSGEGILSILQVYMSSESNRMLGDLYTTLSTQENLAIVERLVRQYEAWGEGDNSSHARHAAYRCALIYMIPRLRGIGGEVKQFIDSFLLAQKNLLEPDVDYNDPAAVAAAHFPLELVAVYNWLTQLGVSEAEARYYQVLSENPEFNRIGRGCYLVYYKDEPLQPLGYQDRGGEWKLLLDAFLEHYERENDIRQDFIRRIDLRTMNDLITARAHVSAEDAERLIAYAEKLAVKPLHRAEDVRRRLGEKAYRRYLADLERERLRLLATIRRYQ